MSSGREAALTSLTACRRLDAWSDGSLKAASRGLDRREAALAARLTYGVLQNRALLDFYLGHYCSQSGTCCGWGPIRSSLWTGCRTAPL